MFKKLAISMSLIVLLLTGCKGGLTSSSSGSIGVSGATMRAGGLLSTYTLTKSTPGVNISVFHTSIGNVYVSVTGAPWDMDTNGTSISFSNCVTYTSINKSYWGGEIAFDVTGGSMAGCSQGTDYTVTVGGNIPTTTFYFRRQGF